MLSAARWWFVPKPIEYDIRWWHKEIITEIRILTQRCENSLYVITRILFLNSSEPVQIETMIFFRKTKSIYFFKIRNRITFAKEVTII